MLRFVCLIVFAALSLSVASAQSLVGSVGDRVDELVGQVDTFSAIYEGIGDDDARLAELNGALVNLQDELVAVGAALTVRLAEIRTRLDQLGPPPEDNEPAEPEILAEERAALWAERVQVNELIGSLEAASIRAKELSDEIAERRRELFTEGLFSRNDLTEAFGSDLLSDLGDRFAALERRISSWASFTWRTRSSATLAGSGLVAAFAVAALAAFARIKGAWAARFRGEEAPSDFRRLIKAFWFVFLPTMLLWIFLALSLFVLDGFDLLRPDILSMLISLSWGAAIIFLVWRLSEAIFAPRAPQWRLVQVSDRASRTLKVLAVLMAVITVGDSVIAQLDGIFGGSLSITVARSLIASLLVGLLLVVFAYLKPFDRNQEQRSGWPAAVKWLLLAVGLFLIGAALVGYIGLARFAAQQIVVTGAVLVTMYLGYLAAKALAEDGALADSPLGGSLVARYQFSDARLDQIGLVAGVVLGSVVLAIGLPILALFWGFQWSDVRSALAGFFTDLTIGSITISITSILIGLVLFVLGYWLTRRFQHWIDGTVLERSRVEAGARNSIRVAIGYVGIAIAALIGASAAGLNLSQLAIVAGALSVGIGFGLQNIVNNFVSGLILLAERPFKTGDIIEAGGHVGTVTNINVRATEIRLFDRKTLILPNSELINQPVSNWMHRNTLGRVMIPVGVSYGSDPQAVHDLLLKIANDHPDTLSNPEPFVAFDDFGASSLDFVLYAFIADVTIGLGVRTELRMQIVDQFRKAGIEIPFPQRDVNLHVVGEGAAPVQTVTPGRASHGPDPHVFDPDPDS